MLGKEVRLNRLFSSKSGNILVIALDHAIGWGVIDGIADIRSTMEKIIESQPDALTMLKGTAQRVFAPYAGSIPFIMKSTTFSPAHPIYDASVGTVEEALRLGADAIATGCTLLGEKQAELLHNLACVSEKAFSYGLPTVTHIYPKGAEKGKEYEKENVMYAARAAAELDIDIVKTFYTGDPESYKEVIDACPSRVVVSGGPKLPSLKDVFQMTYDAMSVGAKGVTYGRNVWQAKDPVAVVNALKHIIHNKGNVSEAMEIAKERE